MVTRPRAELIDDLAADLAPRRWPGRVAPRVLAWWLLAWALVVAVTLALGPLRAGALGQLLASPRFLAESLLGLAAGGGLAWGAWQLGIPAPRGALRRAAPALALLALWVGAYALGLVAPALEPSMLGKRAGCWLQVVAFGTPPLVLGLLALRRLAPLHRAAAGALLGAAAGALPGLLMQLACMYVPAHILTHHIAPIALLSLLGALLAPLTLRRI